MEKLKRFGITNINRTLNSTTDVLIINGYRSIGYDTPYLASSTIS